MEQDDMYLTDKQYLELLIRIRADLDKIEKVEVEDCTDIGYKHTTVNVGVCASVPMKGLGWSKDKYTTLETAKWPEAFKTIGKVKYSYPQQFAMKYRGNDHKCPLDGRHKADGLGFGYGCFYRCRAFNEKSITLKEIKELYDKAIRKWRMIVERTPCPKCGFEKKSDGKGECCYCPDEG